MKPSALIGFVGKKHSGKDECYKQLYEASLAEQIYSCPIRISFGDEVKKEIAEMLDTSVTAVNNNKEMLRKVLQDHGMNRRAEDPAYWIKKSKLVEKIEQESLHPTFLVVTDVRCHNEAAQIRLLGGKLIRIRRKATDDSGDSHVTETELESIQCDHFIYNDESPLRLRFMLIDVLRTLFPSRNIA